MGFLHDLHDLDRQAATRRLQMTGRPGTATITAIRATGDAAVELDLSVSVAGAEPYAVTLRRPLSTVERSTLQPGATIPVRVDPTDPSSLLLG